MEGKEKAKLAQTRAFVEPDGVKHTSSYDYSATFAPVGINTALDMDEFKKDLEINILSTTDTYGTEEDPKESERLQFDIVGADAAVVNTIRRLLIAEVPTMAIEHVFIEDNTSIIQDEVLAHRIGLIPIHADPRMFAPYVPSEGGDTIEDLDQNSKALIRFDIDIACTRLAVPGDVAGVDEESQYSNSRVYSSDLVWTPLGSQAEDFKDDPLRAEFDDILIAKLRPGQRIKLQCYCTKGVGREHAKWSPVATASYRLLPEIVVDNEKVTGERARALQALCPMDVFDIEDVGGVEIAVPNNPRNCSMCRECIREQEWADVVSLRRVKKHMLFSIEPAGFLNSRELVNEAITVITTKCNDYLGLLDNYNVDGDGEGGDGGDGVGEGVGEGLDEGVGEGVGDGAAGDTEMADASS